MVVRKVWLIPVMAVTTSTLGMLSGYLIGNLNGHIQSWIPFISDGGAYAPESCIFSQLLNISAFFLILTFYFRHRQTVEYYGHRLHWEGNSWRISSLIIMWIGIFSAIALTVVANFPETEALTVHNIAAAVTFLTQIIYGWGQVMIGFVMIPRMASMFVNFIRLALIIIATTFLVFHEVTLNLHPFSGNSTVGYEPVADRGYHKTLSPNHTIATSTEWLMVLALQFFILTFVAELRFAYAHVPRIVFCRSASVLGCSAVPQHVKIVHIPSSNVGQHEETHETTAIDDNTQ